MRINLKKYYIEIQSPTLCTLIGRLNGFANPESVKAGAFYPFLYLRFPDHPNNPTWINHEKIHFRQQLELLFIFYFIFIAAERIYYRYFRKLSPLDSYLASAFEQECYINQSDTLYLSRRRPYAFLKYMREKRTIRFVDREGNITITNDELIAINS
ncbi:MAG: hypothetical protein QY318_04815 [Candidatus Dojkabacteria bacterium]|nr:MAG: hypothetical protein QY318_04815 [Candidatus Dojkabacteria bacterium]